MPGDFLRRQPQITMTQFHAFRDERPKEEKWELIDGVPMMMPPPTLIHRRISRDLEMLLNLRLRDVKPEWQADREIGVLLRADEKYNPEPDVTVIDADVEKDQVYAERFYFVAEVLSSSDKPEHAAGSDKPEVLAAKLAYYNQHEYCRSVMVASQDRIAAKLHVRGPDGSWLERDLSTPEAIMDIPDIGPIGRLGDIYINTPLDPFS